MRIDMMACLLAIDDFLERVEGFFLRYWLARAAIVGVALGILILLFSPPLAAQEADAARPYKREYTRIVRSEWGLEAPVATFAAQIHQESGWNARATSPAGARGIAQFMPATANWMGEVDRGLAHGDVYSPAWAFRAQAVYMKWLHARVRGVDKCNQMAFALAAYNGGLGYVYARQRRSPTPGICFRATCEINPGITPANQRENAHYSTRILHQLEPRYAHWGPGSCL